MMRRSMWLFSKRHLKVIGSVAELRRSKETSVLTGLVQPFFFSIMQQMALKKKRSLDKLKHIHLSSLPQDFTCKDPQI